MSALDPARAAALAIDRLYVIARERVRARVIKNAAIDPAALDREQLAAHALAYVATDLAACRQLLAWADAFPSSETIAIAQVFIAEVARNLRSVVWLGATETYPVSEMLVTPADVAETVGAAVDRALGGRGVVRRPVRRPRARARWRGHRARGALRRDARHDARRVQEVRQRPGPSRWRSRSTGATSSFPWISYGR